MSYKKTKEPKGDTLFSITESELRKMVKATINEVTERNGGSLTQQVKTYIEDTIIKRAKDPEYSPYGNFPYGKISI